MLFTDRIEAGERLAEVLVARRYEHPVVLGIPRGGVVVAAEVARALGADLGVVVARKLRAPGQPELAIGAVAARGAAWVDARLASLTGADDAYLEAEIERQSEEAQRREERFDGSDKPHLLDRTVIIVDDGIATGSTAVAAIRAMKSAGAAEVVLAVPVASPSAIERLSHEADEIVCLVEDPDFFAVGQFYVDFRQVDDDDVVYLLSALRRKPKAA